MIQIEGNEHVTVMPDGVQVLSPDRDNVPEWVRSQFEAQVRARKAQEES